MKFVLLIMLLFLPTSSGCISQESQQPDKPQPQNIAQDLAAKELLTVEFSSLSIDRSGEIHGHVRIKSRAPLCLMRCQVLEWDWMHGEGEKGSLGPVALEWPIPIQKLLLPANLPVANSDANSTLPLRRFNFSIEGCTLESPSYCFDNKNEFELFYEHELDETTLRGKFFLSVVYQDKNGKWVAASFVQVCSGNFSASSTNECETEEVSD